MPVAEFADRFRKFHVGAATAEALAVPYSRADADNKATEGQEAVRVPPAPCPSLATVDT